MVSSPQTATIDFSTWRTQSYMWAQRCLLQGPFLSIPFLPSNTFLYGYLGQGSPEELLPGLPKLGPLEINCSRLVKTRLYVRLSKIMRGVSGPLPSFARIDEPALLHLNAYPPRIARVSRALSRARSRLSPSLSIAPPVGKNACRTCLNKGTSMIEAVTEDVDATGDAEDDAPSPLALRVSRRGSRGRGGRGSWR